MTKTIIKTGWTVALSLLLATALSSTAKAQDEMVVCAYDGSHMLLKAMKAELGVKGRTLHFCSAEERDRFAKNPAAFLRILDSKKYEVWLNFLPPKLYDRAMADMKMADMMKMSMAKVPKEEGTTHYLIVTVVDKVTEKKITKIEQDNVSLELTRPSGEESEPVLYIEPMMRYHMTGVNFGDVGKYTGIVKLNFGLFDKASLNFTYDVKEPMTDDAETETSAEDGDEASSDDQ
ncbi:MAG: hypothetical protein O3A46_07755 [Candidatus Poribacteria bacterium]|nr:hypothetical protein [Candidatus Poribacteria bacterium]